jgi:restriction system protein
MPRFQNQVYWARQYLVWEGLLESTQKGIWKLSSKGFTTKLSEDESHKIFLKWVAIHAQRRKSKATPNAPANVEKTQLGLKPPVTYEVDHSVFDQYRNDGSTA